MDEFNSQRNQNVEDRSNDHQLQKNEDYVGIEPDSSRNEEFASEVTADDHISDRQPVSEQNEHMENDVNSTYGWIGVALSIISYFMMPIILGGAGIILGFISRSRGADTLGNIAIAAGAISIIITLFILPFI
ncbi:hypothetical protein KFZ56_09905 [Virgibacillus sp. NKC19-3]|uniref:hypothetical protein n=1 Tax=Virgibacillus saliphilus TaxID=2831674 RepID=UPI001C9B30D6|nr:hypothetical protein [Virgibacillus sp. NKC19-3]MBY7143365.1 hypothetical protein [Virgibacillus sp. NKC19-3]